MATPSTTTSSRRIPSIGGTSDAFAPFGSIIANPLSPRHASSPNLNRLVSVSANQGSATKFLDVAPLDNYYPSAGKPARAEVNLFVCQPRSLTSTSDGRRLFKVSVLERHPFTAQTFIPLGLAAEDPDALYLIIVAPTLPASTRSGSGDPPYPTPPRRKHRSLKSRLLGARPNPFTNDFNVSTTPAPRDNDPSSPRRSPLGPGQPDLANMRAFIARGDQAVTYAPGTWHAPMVVLGKKPVSFVVVQYANGVPIDDCQEVQVEAGCAVDVDEDANDDAPAEGKNGAGVGIMRAKL